MSHIVVTGGLLARRSMLALGVTGISLAVRPAFAANAQQEMVDQATATLNAFATEDSHPEFANHLKKSVAILIIPELIKAGFIVGGEGGGGVLLARSPSTGGWSAPAFYSLASASFGLQVGAQTSETVFLIRTRKALDHLMADKIKLGADAGLAIASFGAGVEGSATTAAGADILAFSRSKGLYGGVSFEGSVLTSDAAANQRYYGAAVTPREILFDGKGSNEGTARLRARLGAAAT